MEIVSFDPLVMYINDFVTDEEVSRLLEEGYVISPLLQNIKSSIVLIPSDDEQTETGDSAPPKYTAAEENSTGQNGPPNQPVSPQKTPLCNA